MTNYILFDLDGTLVDSSEGIINAVRYATRQMALLEPDAEILRRFIGPPLKQSFMDLIALPEETASEAVRLFREYYSKIGKNQCCLYAGVEDLLSRMHDAGYGLYVATSKPTEFSVDICRRLGIEDYFIEIIGSNMDNTRSAKCEVIQSILDMLPNGSHAVMVGDKKQDLVGARLCGISAVGVLYGFGTLEELQSEPNEAIVNTVDELFELIAKMLEQKEA